MLDAEADLHARQVTEFTAEQYLSLEALGLEKHEFLNGMILAMAGSSGLHSYVCQSVGVALGTRLAGRPCGVAQSDRRIHVAKTGLFTYPDVSVTCGKPVETKGRWPSLLNPTVIVEVLSKSTEKYDRGEKLEHYMTIPSLQAVILVSIRHRSATVWTRTVDGWVDEEVGPGGIIALQCCEIAVPVDEFFAQLHLAGADDEDDA